MSRTASNAQRRNLNARRSADPYIVLATFHHAELSEPLRVARNAAAVTSGGISYAKGWFDIELPTDTADLPRGRMTVPNVDLRISTALLAIATPPRITLQCVLVSDPDTVIERYDFLYLNNITGTTRVVSGVLDSWDYSTAPYPALSGTQARFPGLFWS
jgi:hypothetical protein